MGNEKVIPVSEPSSFVINEKLISVSGPCVLMNIEKERLRRNRCLLSRHCFLMEDEKHPFLRTHSEVVTSAMIRQPLLG